ncbi:dihydroorotase [Arcicella aurantiaca]|uniref:Dihydroorotase n=1 Tax=Arcicella aurantiaca TaxID=591202 RepID=A0A316EFG4_9BACT|nr:dihydroorotase [Arcicella aurantiaca]PWK29340.1 dihydroorotase [Arcicella aurantiaca]
MKTLIRSAKIICKSSEFNGQTKDIFIENGNISQIADFVDIEVDDVIEGEDICVSVGWFDMRVHAKEPGHEYKESLESMEQTALAGGFSEIALLPNTQPVVQTRESVNYLKRSGEKVKFHPMAAVTLKCEGKDFTEMIDLHQAGAVAFTDGEHPIQNPDIFLKSLQYLTQFGGLLINHPEDTHLTHFGQMHDGTVSTFLGMKGMPQMAEEIMVMRDLKILEYVMQTPFSQGLGENSVLHFSCISSAQTINFIRMGKEMGLPISCDVAAHQLCFTENDLVDFDTNLKVNPPFRTQEDLEALWEGLADGTIDVIVSDHNPQDEESKKLEFDMAEFGVIGLETVFSSINTFNKVLSLEEIIEKITDNPRNILRLKNPNIKEGEKANLTIFSPNQTWVCTEKNIVSKSRNSPFIGKTLKGKVIRVIA